MPSTAKMTTKKEVKLRNIWLMVRCTVSLLWMGFAIDKNVSLKPQRKSRREKKAGA